MPGELPEARGSPSNIFRYVDLQAAEGQPRQISESLAEFLSGLLECRAGRFGICAPVSDPRRSCLSRRQLVVSMLFAIFHSEALLRELDRCRETVLQIPITQSRISLIFGIQLAVAAISNLT